MKITRKQLKRIISEAMPPRDNNIPAGSQRQSNPMPAAQARQVLTGYYEKESEKTSDWINDVAGPDIFVSQEDGGSGSVKVDTNYFFGFFGDDSSEIWLKKGQVVRRGEKAKTELRGKEKRRTDSGEWMIDKRQGPDLLLRQLYGNLEQTVLANNWDVSMESQTGGEESINENKLRAIIRDHNRIVEKKQRSTDNLSSLKKMIRSEVLQLAEGEVFNLFSDDQDKKNAVERIAHALAARAEELLDNKIGSVEASLDLDGGGDNIEVDVDVNIDPNLYKLFLQPYPDIDGHGDLVTALAEQIYGHTKHEDVVGTSEDPLSYILSRIETDMYDEDIEYALEALGDDRFAPPFVNRSQHSKTKDMAAQQDPGDVGEMELDFDKYLKGIESGDVVEFPYEEDED